MKSQSGGLVEAVDDETAAELGLEPCGLGRHDVAGVGNVHDLIHADGEEGKGCYHLAAIDAALEFAVATETADKVDALAGAEVADLEDILEDETAADVNVEYTDGIGGIEGAGLGFEGVPFAIEIESKLVSVLGVPLFGTLEFNGKVEGEFLEELFLGATVEVLHNAVVVEDGELFCRETYGHVEGTFCIGASSLLCTYAGGGSRAVVTIGNVESIHLSEFLRDEGLVGSIADHPELVAEAVDGCYEIVNGLLGCYLVDEGKECGIVLEGEEDGLNVGIGLAYVTHAIIFFIATREFVLLDDAVHIVVHVGTDNDAVLPVKLSVTVGHGLGVEVVVLLSVLHEPTLLLEHAELACTFGVAALVVLGTFGLEVDFGLDDMIETLLVVAGFDAGFIALEYVVRTALDEFNEVFGRTYAAERFDAGHSKGLRV